MDNAKIDEDTIFVVVGLGYVGLPIAYELAKQGRTVVGYDINQLRVAELIGGHDHTNQLPDKEMIFFSAAKTRFVTELSGRFGEHRHVFIVTVPTPIYEHDNTPDYQPLISASKDIGRILSPYDLVIYESTVAPGDTENICRSELEMTSGLLVSRKETCDEDEFYLGYSPERVSPGPRGNNWVTKLNKLVSGMTHTTVELVKQVYEIFMPYGTLYKCSSIRVAEASKLIENVQRDVNIALMNGLVPMLSRMGINTNEVVDAASTKYNFMSVKPGLVGGHCISVDPYYLLQRAADMSMSLPLVQTAREINGDKMIEDLFLWISHRSDPSHGALGVLGYAYKPDVPDFRNSGAVKLIKRLRSSFKVLAHDPYDEESVHPSMALGCRHVLFLVPHSVMPPAYREPDPELPSSPRIIFDPFGHFVHNKEMIESRGHKYYSWVNDAN